MGGGAHGGRRRAEDGAREGGAPPPLSEMEARIAETILRELRARVGFLVEVGLGYLTLDRQTRTLSGGEAQRINLANSLGSSLVDTLYVLDEPTVGLHPRDTGALLGLLRKLRVAGNTVVVVEHDPQAIRTADHVVELGPASGEQGGQLVYQGPPGALAEQDTVTGRYLSGRSGVPLPERRRDTRGRALTLRGARLHNVHDVDIEIPLGTLTVVTGVSGSGKSTLVHDILYRALERELGGETSAKEHLGEAVGAYDALEGATALDAVVLVDQSPIGRTPRSNPVTYIKAWDHIRKLFAEQQLAQERGYGAGHFSFNTAGGRCEECKGAGYVEIEMIFMADVYVPCDACGGKRYTREMLDVKVKGKNVSEVLDLTVDEAIRFFIRERRLGKTLWHLQQVGLGYLRLGQPAPTLSGGEAQRLKIARELSRRGGKAGPEALHPGRADHRAVGGGRAQAGVGPGPTRGRRKHGPGHRARHGRGQGRGLDHRHGTGGGRQGRRGGRDGSARRPWRASRGARRPATSPRRSTTLWKRSETPCKTGSCGGSTGLPQRVRNGYFSPSPEPPPRRLRARAPTSSEARRSAPVSLRPPGPGIGRLGRAREGRNSVASHARRRPWTITARRDS